MPVSQLKGEVQASVPLVSLLNHKLRDPWFLTSRDAVCARTGVTFAARAAGALTKPTGPSPRGRETNHG
jgi:hypothetical protein